MSAADLGRGIAAGEIDPLALTQTYLTAAEDHEAGGDIYARLTVDRALSAAQAASARAASGQRLSALDGVPISWKDLFDTAGTATEAGSALLAGRIPDRDAAVLARADAAGLICLGKTHLSELAFAGLGHNPVTGSPACVNDPEAVSGGSSSGAAASVAFGMAAAAIGSDTGGSVRVPAAWNDLVGLKTTHGLLPLDGVVALCPRFDSIGPLARSVEDAALLLALLTGDRTADLQGATLSGARLAVLETVVLDDLDPVCARAFETALEALGDAGADLVRVAHPELADAMGLSAVLYTVEAWAQWGETIAARPEVMYDRVRERFEAGQGFDGPSYVRAWTALARHRAKWHAAMAGFDAVLAPSTANMPPARAAIASDADLYVAENLRALRNTRVGNLMGLPALSLPTGTPSAGLMLMGQPMQDRRLLRVGAAAEHALSG